MAEDTAPPEQLLDLGSDHALERVPYPGEGAPLAGYVLRHKSAIDGSPCGCFLAFSEPHSAAGTQLVVVQSEDPLTLAPAPLVCAVCGDSGKVEEGKWISNPAAAVAAEPAPTKPTNPAKAEN